MRNPFSRASGPRQAQEASRGWRVGHLGRDRMYYEERRGGRWERLEIDGEMLMGPAHHVIYFPTPGEWTRYPEWAQGRRDEIIGRIKSEFRPAEYQYHGDQPDAGPTGPAPSTPPPPGAPRPHWSPTPRPAPGPGRPQPAHGARALLIGVVLLLLLGAGMAWLAIGGVARGETRLPIRQAYLRRPVSRQHEPATFWLAIGCYVLVGGGAVTLGLLGAREWRRLR